MATKTPAYTPQEREAALAIFQEHGPGEAARQTGINRCTISSWAKRAAIKGPNAERTKAATKAAQAWARRRVSLRDLSGEAAEEFLAAARAKMKENARAATDHMRSFSIAVTTANTLAAQTADEPSPASGDFDAEVDKMLDEMMSAAEQKVRRELLDEMDGTGEPGTVARDTPRFSAAQNGAGGGNDSDMSERPPASAPARQSPTNGEVGPSALDTRIRYGEFVP